MILFCHLSFSLWQSNNTNLIPQASQSHHHWAPQSFLSGRERPRCAVVVCRPSRSVPVVPSKPQCWSLTSLQGPASWEIIAQHYSPFTLQILGLLGQFKFPTTFFMPLNWRVHPSTLYVSLDIIINNKSHITYNTNIQQFRGY